MSPPKVSVSIKKGKIGDTAFQSLGTVEKWLKKGPIFPALIIVSGLLYVIMLGLNAFASNPRLSHGIFKYSISNVSKMYPLNITPAGWTFSIWGIIFLLQLAAVIYSCGLLCRQTDNGPAYLNPPVLSPLYFLFFSLSSIFVSIWLFMWDNLMITSSCVFLLCTVISLWTAFSIASERLSFFRGELIDAGRSIDVNVITISVLNGLGMYATWSIIASLINMSVVLVYTLGQPLSNENASILSLSIVAVFVILYSSLDMTVFERANRFTLTPYLTIIWAMSGIISKNWDLNQVSSLMSAALLGCGVITLIVKIVVSVTRTLTNHNPYRRMKVAAPTHE